MADLVIDRLAWAYIGIDIAWTVALICGMGFLYYHRELPCIRIRRLPILFLGIIPLHLYGFICVIGYVLGALVPCTAMFWIMSIYLPFGIAMFQTANSQFLYIASRQKQFAHLSLQSDQAPLKQEEAERLSNSRWRRILRGVDRADKIERMMVYIGLGLAVQLAITILVFFGSKKFHPSYGLWDWDTRPSAPELVGMECSKGWEWWLSIVWQFFWAWIYAPYMLFKSRGINDVHGWRLQTICCCIVGLPASPMWLAGLYAPGMAHVNMKFIPPMWFSVCIFFMELVTIGFPIFEIFKTHKLRQETLHAIAAWEKRQEIVASNSSNFSSDCSTKQGLAGSSTSFSINEVHLTSRKSLDSQRSDLYTMTGLENALRTNAVPLLQFAALRDFSGENISFLMHMAEWRRAWLHLTVSTAEHRRQQFITAVSIYGHFVSPSVSEFPINISHVNMAALRDLFEEAASHIFCKRSIASGYSPTPFEEVSPDSGSTVDLRFGINLDVLGHANLNSVANMIRPRYEDVLTAYPIPEAFRETVFDATEKEIKYLVLTNTWPKFVNDVYASSQHDFGELKEAQDENWFKKSILCAR
ncbi:hypothetical protein P171DRAFT_187887 [Karstenula rhodostoma CBS 690.94]|uniref:RGS domain-containing protein n=1 Tax=Karstenula rhodostoma CBS 690.94 TaxID=1392251 RepID=A0A9P4PS62_9PLEO|nr:hypothetical protein P171DRAFT_187887 [Karstenula rhodostoma CBS 690.94]